MAAFEVILTITYFSFRVGIPPAVRQYPTRSNNECVRRVLEHRAKRLAGRAVYQCNGRRI